MIANVHGIALNYEQEGTGPDLVLIPGLGAGVHVWYAQLKGLSPVLRVTAVDPRGHGLSDKPPGPYSLPLFAADSFLSTEKALVLVASSGDPRATEIIEALQKGKLAYDPATKLVYIKTGDGLVDETTVDIQAVEVARATQ